MMASSSFSADAKNRQTISDGERANATWQVQNIMSKHAYYHAAGMHIEELNDIWVDAKGPYAKTATFASPSWIMHGIAGIMKNYGEGHQKDKVTALEAVSKLYPEIKNVKENIGAGSEWAMHTNTTPVIEVAGDGKTAKGIWYSPGMGLNGHINGTSVSVGSTFFWEKYGADFIKENGVWKMWHCQMFYDFTPSLPASMTANLGTGTSSDQAGGQGGQGGAPAGGGQGGAPAGGGQGGAPAAGGQGGAPGAGGQGGAPAGGGQGGDQAGQGAIEAGERMSAESLDGTMGANPAKKYENWSIKRVPTIAPAFPVPYYTFSETFSY